MPSTEYQFYIVNQQFNERSIQTVGKGALRHARVRDSRRRAEDPGSGSDREAGREDGALGVLGGAGGARRAGDDPPDLQVDAGGKVVQPNKQHGRRQVVWFFASPSGLTIPTSLSLRPDL